MKKLYFCAIASFLFSACSSDSVETIEENNELVKASVKIAVDQTEEGTTRLLLGKISGNRVPYLFELGDRLTVVDELGVHDDFSLQTVGADNIMVGTWGNPADYPYCVAFAPHSGTVTVKNNQPTFHFVIPTSQTSRDNANNATFSETGISFQDNTGFIIAAQNDKKALMKFLPVASYLYFYSSYEYCQLRGANPIAGNFDVTYKGAEGTNSGDPNCGNSTFAFSNGNLTMTATIDTIFCHGKVIPSHSVGRPDLANKFEYMIAVKPGLYPVSGIKIKAFNAGDKTWNNCFRNLGDAVTFNPGSVYYLGCID